MFGGGTGSLALVSGGTPAGTNATEEWTVGQNVKTITD
jgi:hypothetical protein